MNLIKRLANRHRITYICHRNLEVDEAEAATNYLGQIGIETIVVDHARPLQSVLSRGPRFYAALAANLCSARPYLVDVNDSPALRSAVAAYGSCHDVDLWQCEWTPYCPSLDGLPGSARRLVMAHNVESLIWQRYYENESHKIKRLYIGHQWRKFVRFEQGEFARADATVTVSDADARIVRDQFGLDRVEVVDNGVDVDHLSRPSGLHRLASQVLFLGSLDWRPNLDAVDQLLEFVWPAIRAARPDARLCIVGRNPSWDLRRRISATPGAALHADVPDVRPFLWQSAVMIVPLRIGGGSRLKILEAFAAGLPVVSTRVGAEGLDAQAGSEYFGADAVAELAGATLAALGDPSWAREVADRARQLVHQRYDWAGLAERLERIWIETADPARAAHRNRDQASVTA
ncbi:glycosyltransferase family 4 protein [Tautonia sp. JC769]|uniref:glycosyltransferase family 4 protein n=1 Tax=Tautonia sp. JC769 TaxID=3232135 RepID=UPI00345801F3